MSMQRYHRLLLLLLLAWGMSCDKKSSELSESCRATGMNRLQRPGLQVYLGSSLDAGELRAGEIPSCSTQAEATEIYSLAARALDLIPDDLRPAEVTIHVNPGRSAKTPPIDVSEVHRKTRSILIDARELSRIDLSTLLHEIAHVQMASRAPKGVIASRLEESLGEGIADYYAAAIQKSPLLGKKEGKAARDLGKRPIWLRGGWSRLRRASEPWAAHEQGWALGALLWEQDASAGPLLRDLVTCMQNARLESSESVAEVMDQWLRSCPEASRETIAELVDRWIPSSMY
jgi:hypothetical protein